MKKILTSSSIFLFFCLSFFYGKYAFAFDQNQEIFINQSYDSLNRSSIYISQVKPASSAVFYADKTWWNSLSFSDQNLLQSKMYLIASELEYKIKPILNSTFGQEPEPITGTDTRLNIVLTPMAEGVQGYIRTNDFVLKSSNKSSNEGNVVYLNANKLKTVSENISYSFLAHEFMHLISYNQKFKIKGVHEEIWLEELRAEYASTLVGYNNNWDSSYLKIRAADFFKNNLVSFLDWDNQNPNYASLNLFAQYLGEKYTSAIITESFRSSKVGIDSLNEYLSKKGDNFDQVFQNWLIANILNDCQVSSKYCYQNINLKNLSMVPASFYLPMNGSSALAISDTFVPYMAKYQKISGGSSYLNLDFENASDNLVKKIPYIIVNKDGSKKLFFFEFQNNKSQKIVIPDFNKETINLILVPYLIRNDKNFSNRSIFRWSAQAGQGVTAPNTDTPIIIAPTKPSMTLETLSATIERQQLLITLQTKLILLMQQLLTLLLAR